MKQLKNGFWIPDTDTHFEKWFEACNWEHYQIRGILRSLTHLCGRNETAIDCGAHVGFITKILQYVFHSVVAFEPSEVNFECLKKNCSEAHTTLINRAVDSVKRDKYLLTKAHNTGGNYTTPVAVSEKKIRTCTIDSFVFNDVDFIKFDIQGDEYDAILGAEKTIKKYKPLLMVEDMERDKIPQLLKEWNYQNYANYKKDMFWKAIE